MKQVIRVETRSMRLQGKGPTVTRTSVNEAGNSVPLMYSRVKPTTEPDCKALSLRKVVETLVMVGTADAVARKTSKKIKRIIFFSIINSIK